MRLFAVAAALIALIGVSCPARAQTLDKISFGTNWVAEAEHGGFYQAVADGTYAKYGLDVTIVPGGPNVNNRLLLVSGKLDFAMTANTLLTFDAVAQGLPVVSVAAIFQKDPQVFLLHPPIKPTSLADLKPLTLFLSKEAMAGNFQWMKSAHGFSEARVKPYTFNPQPFLADPNSAMQGYVTSEPYLIEKLAGFKPNELLLADHGFDAYSTLIDTRREIVERKPDVVQRFVDASIVGWYHYLYGDSSAGNALIRKTNPEMTDDLLAYSIKRMKDAGIVDSGDTLRDGIGAMNEARIGSFYTTMSKAGAVKNGLDYRRAFTLQFVNKGVGVELRPN
jgi:NitT/TauT family transport system substrate-binding protein